MITSIELTSTTSLPNQLGEHKEVKSNQRLLKSPRLSVSGPSVNLTASSHPGQSPDNVAIRGGIPGFPGYGPYSMVKEQDDSAAASVDLKSGPFGEFAPAQFVSSIGWLVKTHPKLTTTVRSLLPILSSIILSKALRSGLKLSGMYVDIESDPEEGTSQVVLRVYTQASAVQTLAFWDSLDIEIARWIEHLSARERKVIVEEIGLRFHWAS